MTTVVIKFKSSIYTYMYNSIHSRDSKHHGHWTLGMSMDQWSFPLMKKSDQLTFVHIKLVLYPIAAPFLDDVTISSWLYYDYRHYTIYNQ